MFLLIQNTKEIQRKKQPKVRENQPQFDLTLERVRLHSSRLTDTRLGTRNSDRSLWSGVALHSPLEVMGCTAKSGAEFMSGSDSGHSFT